MAYFRRALRAMTSAWLSMTTRPSVVRLVLTMQPSPVPTATTSPSSSWPGPSTTHVYHSHTHRQTHPLSGTTRVSRYQKGEKSVRILLKQETMSGSGISWTICKSAPHSRQKTLPAPHHSVFTGQMPFLPPNQQRQSTECKMCITKYFRYLTCRCAWSPLPITPKVKFLRWRNESTSWRTPWSGHSHLSGSVAHI